MQTQSHLLLTAAAFTTLRKRSGALFAVMAAALLLGSILPDIPLFLLTIAGEIYYRWLAPLLLLWPRLSPETRRRLELQACENPAWLARVERLLPPLLEPERVRAALVAARLEAAQGSGAEAFL